jgi:hypothetical protein
MADGEDNMLNILAASGMRAGDHGSGATVRWRRSSASLLASELVEKVEKRGGLAAARKEEKEEAARVSRGSEARRLKWRGKWCGGGCC